MMPRDDEQTIKTASASGRDRGAIQVADPQDESRLLATLTSAFINDPPVRWLYPEPDRYLQHYPAFARAFGGGAFKTGTAWHSDDFAACALWYAPGSAPNEEALIAVIEETITPQRHTEVFAVLDVMGKVHPTEPHWYLPLIGVDTVSQGRGLGPR